MRTFKKGISSGLFLMTVLIGCKPEPNWKLQRQVVDSAGKPLSKVQVDATGVHNLHNWNYQLGLSRNKEQAFHLVTDTNGGFKVDCGGILLILNVHKSGYVPKVFFFLSAGINPQVPSPTGTIELSNEQAIHPPDELDLREEGNFLLRFPTNSQNASAIKFPEGEIVSPSDADATILVEMRPQALEFQCLHGAQVALTDWEFGLEAESWKLNHQAAPHFGYTNHLTVKCTSAGPAGAFFLKAVDSKTQPYYVRVYVDADRSGVSYFHFNVSRDEFFVQK